MIIDFCEGKKKEYCDRRSKPKRMKCDICGRRLLSFVEECSAGCCVWHSLPKHKPKGYKKKPRQKSNDLKAIRTKR